ncbi:MAG: hypothetical protein KME25_17530 [Symplocastrum torsivum CPER-KK1]|jgi:hypothetical protein|uniref:Uncharacterized protein n=1 Tax=Symplocastrum torsivum CPER-KK1 TaxID=450513 RepID=A0A951UAW0_9CYAN|nr:hypothetical protein [Symplocastrum torsivum CPER-KK1]
MSKLSEDVSESRRVIVALAEVADTSRHSDFSVELGKQIADSVYLYLS